MANAVKLPLCQYSNLVALIASERKQLNSLGSVWFSIWFCRSWGVLAYWLCRFVFFLASLTFAWGPVFERLDCHQSRGDKKISQAGSNLQVWRKRVRSRFSKPFSFYLYFVYLATAQFRSQQWCFKPFHCSIGSWALKGNGWSTSGQKCREHGHLQGENLPIRLKAVAFYSQIPMRQLGKAWVWKGQVVPEPYVASRRSIDQDI